MSQHIDFSKPLSDADRSYLESRGRYADIERVDATTGVETPPFGEGDGTGLYPESLLTADVLAARKGKLLAELAALEEAEAASGAPPEEDDTEDDDEVPGYETWKLAKLQEEIDLRNEDRAEGDKLDRTGTKAVLVDRLYSDDEKADQAQA